MLFSFDLVLLDVDVQLIERDLNTVLIKFALHLLHQIKVNRPVICVLGPRAGLEHDSRATVLTHTDEGGGILENEGVRLHPVFFTDTGAAKESGYDIPLARLIRIYDIVIHTYRECEKNANVTLAAANMASRIKMA